MALPEAHKPTPQEELNEALRDFNAVNAALPPGMNPIQLNLPLIELTSALDALVRQLIDSGTLDEQAFIAGKARRMAELVRASTDQARKAKRDALGIVLAGSGG